MPGLLIDVEGRFNKFQDSLDQLNRSVAKAGKQMDSAFAGVGKTLAALGVGLAAGGFVTITKRAIDAADKLNDLSKKTSLTVEQLSGLQLSAEQSGTSLESVANAIGKLNVEAAKAGAGIESSNEAFKAMGISVKEASGSIKPSEQLFAEIADKIASYADGANKAALAQRIFGKSYQEILPLLNEGGESFRKNAEYAKRFGGTTTTLAKNADAFNDEMAKLKLLSEGFGRMLASELLPSLQKLVEMFVAVEEKLRVFSTTAEVIGFVFANIGQFALETANIFEYFGKKIAGVAAMGAALVTGDFAQIPRIFEAMQEDIKKTADEYNKLIGKITRGSEPLDIPKPSSKKKPAPGIPDLAKQNAALNTQLENSLKAIDRANDREKELMDSLGDILKSRYDQNLISTKDYYTKLEQLQYESIRKQLKGLADEDALLRKAIKKAPDEAARSSLEGKLQKVADDRSKLEIQAGKLAQKTAAEKRVAELAYADAIAEANAQLLEQQGRLVDAAKIRQAVQNRALETRPSGDTESKALLELNKQSQDYSNTLTRITELRNADQVSAQRLANAEESLQLQKDRGAISEFERLNKSDEARKMEAASLRESAAKYRDLVGTIQDTTGEFAAMADAYDLAAQRMEQSTGQLGKQFDDIFAGEAADALVDFASGTKSFSDAVEDMTTAVARSLTKLISQKLFEQLMASASGSSGASGGSASGGWGSIIASFFSAAQAKGGAWLGGHQLNAYAMGGVVTSPRFFKAANGMGIMGEAGPEGILPLKRGADGKLGVQAHGQSQQAIIQNIYVTTPDVRSFAESSGQTAKRAARGIASAKRDM